MVVKEKFRYAVVVAVQAEIVYKVNVPPGVIWTSVLRAI